MDNYRKIESASNYRNAGIFRAAVTIEVLIADSRLIQGY